MPGYGNINADIMLIDYEVTQTQDQDCNYYGGRSGELLVKMIENVLDLTIDDVYLTHIVKCRPNNLTHENNFSDMRGHIMDFKTYKLIPVYHPAFLLRNPSLKKVMLHDLRAIKSLI